METFIARRSVKASVFLFAATVAVITVLAVTT